METSLQPEGWNHFFNWFTSFSAILTWQMSIRSSLLSFPAFLFDCCCISISNMCCTLNATDQATATWLGRTRERVGGIGGCLRCSHICLNCRSWTLSRCLLSLFFYMVDIYYCCWRCCNRCCCCWIRLVVSSVMWSHTSALQSLLVPNSSRVP